MKLNRIFSAMLAAAVFALTAGTLNAQFKDLGYEMGIYGGVVQINNESDGAKMSGAVEARAGYPLLNPLQAELGLGFRELRGKDFHGVVMPIDVGLRFSPISTPQWIPYVYGGIGLLHFDASKWPETVDPSLTKLGWTAVVPVGVGV